jgi:hypothetical protein
MMAAKPNRFGAAKRSAADKLNALSMALANMDDDRILQLVPANLTWTGAAPREIECRLLAKQGAIQRRRGV